MEETSCHACHEVEQKLYSVEENNLQQALEDLTDLPIGISSLPLYLCYLCRALVLKFAAFRAAYRYTHLILRAIQNVQIINGEIMQQEHNVRKKAGVLLSISKTIQIDIYNEEVNGQKGTAKKYSKVYDNNDYSNEINPELVQKTIYIDSDLIRNQIESAANYNSLNEIDYNHGKTDHIVQNDHDYIMSNCDDEIQEAGKEKIKNNIVKDNFERNIEEEFLTSADAKSDIWELDTEDELENFYSNIKSKQKKLRAKNYKRIENNKTTSETCNDENNKQNGNETNNETLTMDVDQQNKNNRTRKKYVRNTVMERENLVFQEGDKYNSQSRKRKKTRQHYEEFAKKNNMKVNFLLTKDEQMNAFLARKETDKYKKAPYKCELCYIGFMTSSAHTNHMKRHDKQKHHPFECDICHRYFTVRRRLSHVDTHRVQYICLQCGKILTIQSSVEQHFIHHSDFKYECKTCFKTFRFRSSYYMHIRLHRSLASCSFCNETFMGPRGLKGHMHFIHPEAKDCFCSSCDRQFSNEAALTTHKDSCSSDNSPCVRCGASFPSDEQLAEHVAEEHNISFVCECKKQFRRKNQLRDHVRYFCKRNIGTANEQIVKKRKRIIHQSTLCEVCGKTLLNVYVLRDHMRVHTGERPYKCTECGKGFRLLTTLQIHMLTHTDERRYKCSLCPKAFRQHCHLRAHMFSHTKERLYACKTCPKRYTGQGSLKEHVDTAHRGLPPRRRRVKKLEKQELQAIWM